MTKQSSFYRDWLAQPRVDFLSGLVVGLALIPEAIGFSVVAGVPPEVGLYASVVIATIIAFTGGRVAMVSAATASTAVLMGPIVHRHGLGYLLAATILMGVFQILAGIFKLGRLMRFVSQSVMTGFVNALAILIFMAQLPQLIGVPYAVYGLTAQILDDMTDTPSNKSRECIGQGIANIGSALFGGMGGCAMIGQSVINVTSGGRGRLSTLVAGIFLLILLVLLHGLLAIVPVAALTAVMIMVSINTFSWRSIPQLRTNPWPSSIVMVATVLTVVFTGDLSKGVAVGVLLSGIFFAGKVSRLVRVTSRLSEDGTTRRYLVEGQVFFASAGLLGEAVDVQETAVKRLEIDVSRAHFWDISAVGALDRIVMKARRHGLAVEITGLNQASETMVERFAAHRNGEALPSAH